VETSGERGVLGDLYAAGADVVLSAHKHNYERFAPQTRRVSRTRAAASASSSSAPVGRATRASAPDANSEVRDAATYGVLELTLHPTSYVWQFVPVAGQSFSDNGSASCH
jgi:hypothetical protein